MKLNFKRKKTIKNILSLALCCLLVLGAVMGTVAITKEIKKETKTIHPAFSVGVLDSNGKFKESVSSIYTKEAFECKGLSVKLDFNSTVKYQAYFYDEMGEYITCSEVLTTSNKFVVPSNSTHARLVVYPIWGADVDKADRECHWYDAYKYSSQLKITVLKEQERKNVDIMDTLTFTELGFKRNSTYTMNADAVSGQNYVTTLTPVYIAGVETVKVYVPAGGKLSYITYSEHGIAINNEISNEVDGSLGEVYVELDIHEYAAYIHFNISLENVSSVSEYAIYVK